MLTLPKHEQVALLRFVGAEDCVIRHIRWVHISKKCPGNNSRAGGMEPYTVNQQSAVRTPSASCTSHTQQLEKGLQQKPCWNMQVRKMNHENHVGHGNVSMKAKRYQGGASNVQETTNEPRLVKSDTRGTREAEANKQTNKSKQTNTQTNKTNQNSGAVTGNYGTYGDLTTRSSRAKGHTEQEAGRGQTTTSRLGRSRRHRGCCWCHRRAASLAAPLRQ